MSTIKLEQPIAFARVCCDRNELKYVQEVIESGWLTTAGKAFELERRFAEAVGARYACAVNSCTAALHLAVEALSIGPGDKVFVPTMTFTASAEIVRYVGADPVFLDVDYATRMITPMILHDAIRRHSDVKMLILVHFGGQAAQMLSLKGKGILEICKDHGIPIIEDAAHAFPSREGNRMVGSFGDVTCFSFYANKTITTGEGGMLVTNDESIAKRARVMRLHGIDRDIWNRFISKKPSWEYDVIAPGLKYNMPDINAAIGLAQMERAEEFRVERQRCAEFYLAELSGISFIDLPTIRVKPEDHSWHLFPIVLHDDAPVTRNQFIELMAKHGIGTSVHYKPLHRMTYYRKRYKLDPQDFPNAERIWRGTVSLPIYPSLSNEDLQYIVTVTKQLLKH